VIGIHFFNAVPARQLVELVPSLLTSSETTARSRTWVEGALGKTAIVCQDRAGFVVNALLIPFILSAVRMYESGVATAQDIDRGLVLGAAHPQGPLALADLIGLDTTAAVARSLYEEFRESLYAPPSLLQRMVDAGLLGRKTGRGSTPTADGPTNAQATVARAEDGFALIVSNADDVSVPIRVPLHGWECASQGAWGDAGTAPVRWTPCLWGCGLAGRTIIRSARGRPAGTISPADHSGGVDRLAGDDPLEPLVAVARALRGWNEPAIESHDVPPVTVQDVHGSCADPRSPLR
jgi:hypothetical protein